MTTMVYNEDGSPIWVDPNEKLEKVKQAILPQLETIKKKWDRNEVAEFPRKLEFNSYINQLLVINFRKFPKISSKYAVDIDIETLRDYVNCYFDLVEFILSYYQEFVSTKPLFCMFCGVEPYCYNQWLISQNPDVLAEIQFVETHLEEITVLSAQTGKLKEKSSENRLKSNGIGHNLNLKTAEESTPTINLVAYDAESISRQIANMGIKLIDKK